jgi:methionyl-tRNA synthetase
LKPGTQLVAGENIFPRKLRLEPETDQSKVTGATIVLTVGDAVITIDDFAKVKLRVAEVLACERIPDATKLLKLQISVGEEQPRQIVAGIAEYYTSEQLGRRSSGSTLADKIRARSNGMLLAAKSGKQLAVLTVDRDLPAGATIS